MSVSGGVKRKIVKDTCRRRRRRRHHRSLFGLIWYREEEKKQGFRPLCHRIAGPVQYILFPNYLNYTLSAGGYDSARNNYNCATVCGIFCTVP